MAIESDFDGNHQNQSSVLKGRLASNEEKHIDFCDDIPSFGNISAGDLSKVSERLEFFI